MELTVHGKDKPKFLGGERGKAVIILLFVLKVNQKIIKIRL